ncbi:tryptophanyl-tRNA synthetase [Acetobacter malorum DSM 14337]|uniref:Tryptophan--tRNA ligase n=1 Tax=Acetobacter malorum DSM 14337 TaxID=1307910 RepID=A0ABQ0PYW4_9PROT|nr:tryptophan--tRNA ligase [Acetobacter malorum]KXV06815.1 tryptophanyl-tRNA synthetase [Acetobacter malorum]GBQ85026.1 tryptophanyl-tRNA synthetase [Acetobacter malorum DSM 14337]
MSFIPSSRQTILTGDRTTGPLHIGHYAGSLRNRVALQYDHDQFLLLANCQAITDNASELGKSEGFRAGKGPNHVIEVALDYLAAGIDPAVTTICVQSELPALAELSLLYLNFVSVARLERNPTVKEEIKLRGFMRDVPAGFLCYPAAQAADITAFRATLVPAGADQAPMIELSNEIVRRINRQVQKDILPEAKILTPPVGRLPAPNGKGKMSKSLGTVISLSASDDQISDVVMSMYTDPDHIRTSDPGRVEGNVVFTYLDAFDDRAEEVQDLKMRYQRGGVGDVTLKRRLIGVLQGVIAPIRERRFEFGRRPDYVMDILATGARKGRAITDDTKRCIEDHLGIFRLR